MASERWYTNAPLSLGDQIRPQVLDQGHTDRASFVIRPQQVACLYFRGTEQEPTERCLEPDVWRTTSRGMETEHTCAGGYAKQLHSRCIRPATTHHHDRYEHDEQALSTRIKLVPACRSISALAS